MATLEQLTDRVLIRLSQVAGTGTQIYAEDRIAEMIQHKFDVLFDLAFWDQFYTPAATFALDGTNGTITTDLTSLIKRSEDFQAIFIENSETQIGKAPSTQNLANLSGTVPRVYAGNNNPINVITFFPKTATGNVVASYRTKPDDFAPGEEVDFDAQAIILGTVFDYLEDDGTNPNATQKFQGMFDSRVDQLMKNYAKAPIPLDVNNAAPTGFEITLI